MTTNMAWLLPLAFAFALAIDRLCGEPPLWAHPVVAMGKYLGLFTEVLARQPAGLAFVGGALAWCLGGAACIALAAGLETLLITQLQAWQSGTRLLLAAALLGLLLKPLLAWRMLREEVAAVEAALAESLPAGRARLARLVSRDTTQLSEAEVREAALETLAENLNDSVVAPLFWAMIAGLPGAALYRFANTADAMWGYRDRREWSGKWAARADDALSWIPARLTALGMLLGRPKLWLALLSQARRTPSPNSGWPMAALALRLGLSLGKPGVYRLNPAGRAPQRGDLAPALGLARWSLLLNAGLLALGAAWLRGGLS
ncbi:adenosylcobinamide-phosphate synthase CbiB [Paucibacter sp. DJ2R-2]|uniref:adenosylcobinamide-phosphate synthase CbiB n=1 Tax=Paucibacter sp. DJ2R-2 TaxID=2893558 RepID=UPI0021E3F3B0|nr:adenosylcobinamide-phosphate synthase CbiB [Paucibacter sp. DJ2R-2]MCV2420148.1 adenosylcobinamide-phosphate synthase CbiB [Paucibacter sp. DJ4R-1]MCV2436925.1 adenosylcobinamide-phosphate synthase CbiB [Paucibacter sp. DJ2R-2]